MEAVPRPWLMETIIMVSVRPPPSSSDTSLPNNKTLVTSRGTAKVGTGVGIAVAGVGMLSSTSTAPVIASEGAIWGRLVGVTEGMGVSVGVGVMVGVLEGVGLGPGVGDWTIVGDGVGDEVTVGVGGAAVGDAGMSAEGATVGNCDWALEIRLWQPTRPGINRSTVKKRATRR